ISMDDSDLETRRRDENGVRAGDRVDAPSIGDNLNVALLQLARQAADERREIARIAQRRIVLLLLLQDGHGDFGEVVEHEEIDGPLVDQAHGGFEPVAPEALPIGDADHYSVSN